MGEEIIINFGNEEEFLYQDLSVIVRNSDRDIPEFMCTNPGSSRLQRSLVSVQPNKEPGQSGL
jgi:hypothetical protein